MTATFNPTAALPEGWLALEASAGTGKTRVARPDGL